MVEIKCNASVYASELHAEAESPSTSLDEAQSEGRKRRKKKKKAHRGRDSTKGEEEPPSCQRQHGGRRGRSIVPATARPGPEPGPKTVSESKLSY